MRRTLIMILVLAFILSACGADIEETVEENLTEDVTVQENLSTQIPEEHPVLKPKIETFDPSDYLIEKKIGEYKYKETKTSTKNILGCAFESMETHYGFGSTNAVVSVLYSKDNKINLFEFMTKASEDKNYAFLDAEEVDFVDQDLYFNPYENTYLWVSNGKVILIEDSIGFDLLDKYLEEFSVSVIQGTYQNEDVQIEFKDKDDQKIIYLNNNQYILELANLRQSNNEITIVVNNDEREFEVGDETIVGDLLIKVMSVNFGSEEVKIEIKKEVFDFSSHQLDVGESVEFTLAGRSITLEATSANSKTVSIVLNGDSANFDEGEIKSLDGFEVRLDDLILTNIGEQSAVVTVEVWMED
ncbi:MAG: hypothetical protein ABIB43_06555 [archaeon]